MKKKLALFMAAIMSLTVVPVTSVFGANTVSIVPLGWAANEKEGVYDGSHSENGQTINGIAHFVDIVLDEDVEAGSQFRAEIVGATWSNIDDGKNDFYSVFDPGEADSGTIPRYENGTAVSNPWIVHLAGRLPRLDELVDSLTGLQVNADEAQFDYLDIGTDVNGDGVIMDVDLGTDNNKNGVIETSLGDTTTLDGIPEIVEWGVFDGIPDEAVETWEAVDRPMSYSSNIAGSRVGDLAGEYGDSYVNSAQRRVNELAQNFKDTLALYEEEVAELTIVDADIDNSYHTAPQYTTAKRGTWTLPALQARRRALVPLVVQHYKELIDIVMQYNGYVTRYTNVSGFVFPADEPNYVDVDDMPLLGIDLDNDGFDDLSDPYDKPTPINPVANATETLSGLVQDYKTKAADYKEQSTELIDVQTAIAAIDAAAEPETAPQFTPGMTWDRPRLVNRRSALLRSVVALHEELEAIVTEVNAVIKEVKAVAPTFAIPTEVEVTIPATEAAVPALPTVDTDGDGEDDLGLADPGTPVSTRAAMLAVFGVADAGTGVNSEGFGNRVVWSNIAYIGNKGDSAPQGIAYVKKTGDSRITVTIMDEINVGNDDVVLRLPLPIEIKEDAESVEFNVTNGGGFLPARNYLLVDTTGDGTVTTTDAANGREIIYLEDIRIEELTIGVLDGGAFELTAPAGYRFMNRLNQVKLDTDPDATFSIGALDVDNSNMDYVATGGVNTLVEEGAIAWTDDDDQTSLAIYIDPAYVTKSSTLTSAILVQGLVLEPLDDDEIVDGEELFMDISKYDEGDIDPGSNRTTNYHPIQAALDKANLTVRNSTTDNDYEIVEMDVTNEEFKIGVSVDWGVTLTPKEVVRLEAGRWADDVDDDFHKTAEITLKETEKGGWHADRTTDFILPEGVSIRGLKITDANELDAGIDEVDEFDQFWDNAVDLGMAEGLTGTADQNQDYEVVHQEDFMQGKVSVEGNVMSWKGLDINDAELTEIKFELYLSIAPTFDGEEITIQLDGSAIEDDMEPVVIAEVDTPITLTTKVTNVQIGYQKFSVADIIIQENFAGAILEADNGLIISMEDDYVGFGLEIAGYEEMTVEGDLKLDPQGLEDVSRNSRDGNNNSIVFDVVNASKTASTITLKGVEVYVDRTVPYGIYNVAVHGESVFANEVNGAWEHDGDDIDALEAIGEDPDDEDALFARFTEPYEAPYVNLATEGSYTPLRSHVVISDSNPVVMVDGVEKTMTDVVPYRTTAEGGSFMVPVRFASEVFGIEEKNTLWDDASGTFTLFADGKTIQFIKNAGFYRVNGVDVQMMTGDVQVFSEVDPEAGRMYIPFRHLGRAFGIAEADITFDEATGTAHYNQPREN